MGKTVQVKAGDQYGRLTVVSEVESRTSPTNGRRYRRISCVCNCGSNVIADLESVRAGRLASCGCLQREQVIQLGRRNRSHGLSHCKTYESWSMMKQRCYNPRDVMFHRYGGRGIRVCERWLTSFSAFLKDMGERPAGYSLERINNDGHYEPGNTRWATAKEQQRNRSSNVRLTFRGETMCISAWAERIGLPRKTLEKRLNHYGFTVEQALTLPLGAKRDAT